MDERLRNRREGGEELARRLARYGGRDVLVLALPRGGLPVAAPIAEKLGAPLDVFVVRKLGVPGQEELAMGAIATGGVRIFNQEVIDCLRISESAIAAVAANEERELERREWAFRDGRSAENPQGKIVILVDDGLATGATMRAAVLALRKKQPARLVVAVPVGAEMAAEALRGQADEVICARMPEPFHAVGLWYEEFPQVDDSEVHEILANAARDGKAA